METSSVHSLSPEGQHIFPPLLSSLNWSDSPWESSSRGHFPRIFKWYFLHRNGTLWSVYFDRSVTTAVEDILNALRFSFYEGSSSSLIDPVLCFSEQAFLASPFLNPTEQFPPERKIFEYEYKNEYLGEHRILP